MDFCQDTIQMFANAIFSFLINREDVFQVLKETFTMDYARTLKFQTSSDEAALTFEEPITIPASVSDEFLEVSLLVSS